VSEVWIPDELNQRVDLICGVVLPGSPGTSSRRRPDGPKRQQTDLVLVHGIGRRTATVGKTARAERAGTAGELILNVVERLFTGHAVQSVGIRHITLAARQGHNAAVRA
jgi:hypothetical protein